MLAGCATPADRSTPAEAVPVSSVGPQSVEQVLSCGPRGLVDLYYDNAFSRDDWLTPEKAAAGLGESLLGAKSPQIKTWQSVSTVDAFSHTADTTTWVVYQPSGSPLGVVQVLPTHAGTSSNFMGNVVARCK